MHSYYGTSLGMQSILADVLWQRLLPSYIPAIWWSTNYNSLTQDAQGHHSTQKLKGPKFVGSTLLHLPWKLRWEFHFICCWTPTKSSTASFIAVLHFTPFSQHPQPWYDVCSLVGYDIFAAEVSIVFRVSWNLSFLRDAHRKVTKWTIKCRLPARMHLHPRQHLASCNIKWILVWCTLS